MTFSQSYIASWSSVWTGQFVPLSRARLRGVETDCGAWCRCCCSAAAAAPAAHCCCYSPCCHNHARQLTIQRCESCCSLMPKIKTFQTITFSGLYFVVDFVVLVIFKLLLLLLLSLLLLLLLSLSLLFLLLLLLFLWSSLMSFSLLLY